MSAIDTTLSPVDALRARCAGPVVAPGDRDWDVARQAWNLVADQRPVAVALPESVADVQAIVAVARAGGLRVAAQGTGHNAAPLGDLSDTILLRTTRLTGVEIDVAGRRARVGAGTRWSEVTAPASEHGLAPLAGSAPGVGVVGYTLGGGISWLGRRFGLAANHVHAIELVTADGRFVRATATDEPDLFWALRGGGGSFGVVTAMELALHDVGDVYAGLMLWPWERAAEVMHAWRAWTAAAPDEVTTSIRIMQMPDLPDVPAPLRGGAFVMVDGAFLGSAAEAGELFAPLRALQPVMDDWGMVAPAALSHVHQDPEDPMPCLSETVLLRDLPADALDTLLELTGPGSGSPLLIAEIRHLGAAFARPAAGQGARGTIDGEYLVIVVGVPMTPELGAAIVATGARVAGALAPWAAGQQYLNFVEGPIDPARLFRPEAYARLRAIKAAVDPSGVLRSNHPIPPA